MTDMTWRSAHNEKPKYRIGALVFTHRRISVNNPIGHCEYRVAEFGPTNDLDPESWCWKDPNTGTPLDNVVHWMPLPEPP